MANPFLDMLKTSAPTTPVQKVSSKTLKYQTEARAASANAKKQNSFLGILKNTVKAIPRETAQVGKDIAQGTARAVATVGTTAGNLPFKAANLVTGGTEVPFPTEIPTTGNKITEAVFGGKPIRDVEGAGQNARKMGNEFISILTGKEPTAPKPNKGLNLAVGLAGTLFDLSGFGGKTAVKKLSEEVPEAFIKHLARTSDATIIEDTFKKIGLDEANSKIIAEQLAPVKNIDEVKDILVNFTKKTEGESENVFKKALKAPESAPEKAPVVARETPIQTESTQNLQLLAEEAKKYKNAEEFVKAHGVGEIPSKDSRLLYHVSENPNITELKPQSNGSRGIFVTPGEASRSNGYVYVIDRTKLPDGALKQDPSQARDFYIDRPIPNEAIVAKSKISQGKIETPVKSQLTDFYNKAVGETKLKSEDFGAGQPSDIKGSSRYEATKSKGFDAYFNANYPKQISEADQLIAEGKIRVVSRENKDVYQVKKGNQWLNTRDEDSAVKQVTEKKVYTPKPKEYSPADQKKIEENTQSLEYVRTKLADHPARPLLKFINKKEGEFLDFKSPDYANTPEKRQAIIDKNTKIMDVAKKSFAGTENSDMFDNPDAIKEVIDDYKVSRQIEKGLVAEKQSFKELKPIEKPTASAPILPKSSPIDISEGEGRSIEKQASQALNMLEGEPVGVDVSLPKIIQNTVTNVQKKVHIIDTFLTTPHFVMEKIGFGNEAKMLREGMDEYWKELPKNLDVITKWSKEVSKEGNKNIFRFLDGEAITLKPDEKKVALEIKDWLKNWADRLKLPEDKTISHYITHIFDKELIKKEFDEDLAKIIAERIPGSVYDPFLLKRLGAKGYKQDTWAALDAYTKRATRKVHMDPALEAIQAKAGPSLDMSNIEKSQFNYIKKYIDNINMRPSEAEEGVDNFLKSIIGYKLGQRPTTAVLKFLRQATFRGMLGLNPASALRNLSQGVNTYATLGEKHTAIGYLSLFKRGAGEELAREGVLNAGFVQDRALSATKKAVEKMDKVLFVFFDRAEKINRGAAYFGAKSKALSRGMPEEKAIEYAKKIVRDTQFSFDSIDTPVGMSNDLMKTFTQFQTYTTKQIEFLTHMAKDKNFIGLLRYGLAGMAFVYTIGQAFGMKPKELLPWYRFDTPPSLKFPTEVVKAGLNTPDKFGQKRDLSKKLSDIGKAAIGLIPAGSQMKKTFEGIMAVNEGGSFDKGGKMQFAQDMSTAGKAQSVLFGKYASNEAQNYFNKSEIQSKEFEKIAPLYDQVQSLVKEDKADEAQQLVDQLTDAEYELYKKYRTAEKTKATVQGKKDILPKYLEIQALKGTDIEQAKKMLDSLSDDEYKYYGLVKKQVEKDQKAAAGTTPKYSDEEPQTEQGVIHTVFTYAKAIGANPLVAFNRIFTGQRIRRVDGGAIIVERLPFLASSEIKKERGSTGTMKLDHTIPLQLGGSNSEDNLKLVDEAVWKSYTPVENFLGEELRNKKIKSKDAQKLIEQFKNGEITADDVYNYK